MCSMYKAGAIPDEDLVTRTQAADILGVCLRTLDNMRQRGTLLEGTEVRPIDGGRHVLFHRSKLEKLRETFWTNTTGD